MVGVHEVKQFNNNEINEINKNTSVENDVSFGLTVSVNEISKK